jgi:hypothetical protein
MLKQKRRHQVALTGQVINALTGEAIAGARIKIIQAPDKFIDVVLFKTKLFGLPESFGTERLILFKTVMADTSLNNYQKFQSLQNILDYLQSAQKINNECSERTYSTSDGWFYFTDLPTGFYRLEASFPKAGKRYTNTIIEVEIPDIKNNIESGINIAFSDILKLVLELNPTTVFGKVIDSITNELIDMAKIKIHESEDYAISSRTVNQNAQGNWNYRLVALEPNKPFTTLTVSAQGYVTQRHQVYLQTGDIKQLDFQLVSQ